MKMIYAKLWLNKFIKYNYGKYHPSVLRGKTNWAIVNLSHRVDKRHGIVGHNSRQNIRKLLWKHCDVELKKYQPSLLRRIMNFLRKHILGG